MVYWMYWLVIGCFICLFHCLLEFYMMFARGRAGVGVGVGYRVSGIGYGVLSYACFYTYTHTPL